MNQNLAAATTSESKPARSNNQLLGELLVELGVIDGLGLTHLLSVASETSLPLGRVVVMSNAISEFDLKNVLRCQNLMKEGLIQIDQARKGLEFARRNGEEIDEALYRMGWSPAPGEDMVHLGELLLNAQYVTPQQLSVALAQHEKTGLPLGRVLVLSGVLTDGLLTTAINAQILVRDRKLDRAQAIESLNQAKIRQIPLEAAARERGFYDLPNRTVPRLGELLTSAGLIGDTQLVNALEVSLASKKSIGQVLIEASLLSHDILESALLIQQMIGEGKLNVAESRSILISVGNGEQLEFALKRLEQLKQESKKGVPPLVSMLKLFGCVDDVDVIKAFSVAQNDSLVISQVLLLGGVIDEDTLSKAQHCRQLIESGRLTMEHASILFEYSQRQGVDLNTALAELQWQHGAPGDATEPTGVPVSRSISEQEWLDERASAKNMVASKDYNQARAILAKLSAVVENVHDEQYFECLDAIAETHMLEQNMDLAYTIYTQSLDGKRAKYGSKSLIAAFALNNTGKIDYFKKRFPEAEECAREYIRVCSAILGPQHPHVACGWQNIATVFHIQEKYQQAEHAYKIAIEICHRTLGDGHPTTVRLNRNYANLLHVMDKVKDAQGLDPFAQGAISGNWFAIELPPDQMLLEKE